MRRRLLLCLLTLFAGLMTASPVAAKGPAGALVEWPGLEEPIDLMEALEGDTFWSVTEDLGYFAALASPYTADAPMPEAGRIVAEPTGPVGPAVTVTWLGPDPGPDSGSSYESDVSFHNVDLEVVLHPWASGGPRLFVPGGQTPILGRPTVDTWYPLERSAIRTLHQIGLPSRADLEAAAGPDPAGPPDTPAPAGMARGGSAGHDGGSPPTAPWVLAGAAVTAVVAVLLVRARWVRSGRPRARALPA